MNINKLNIYVIIIFLNVNIFGQAILKLSDNKSDKCFFENNGYRVELNELGYKIIKNDRIIISKNINGIKTIKTSQDNNFTLLSNFENNNNKIYRLCTISLYDKNYDNVDTFVDTVYNDYYANLYSVNNNGELICYDINNNLVNIKKGNELNKIELPYYFNFKTEAQHYLNVDNEYIYIIKNIANPLDDEILPGFTILYKINLYDFRVSTKKIPLNIVSSYLVNGNYFAISGNLDSENKTYLFDKSFNVVNEINERFNLMFNFNKYFVCLNNNQIEIYDSLLKRDNFNRYEKTFNVVDYFALDGNYYITDYFLDKYKIYLFNLSEGKIKLDYQTEINAEAQLFILKLKNIYLLDKNRTIYLE